MPLEFDQLAGMGGMDRDPTRIGIGSGRGVDEVDDAGHEFKVDLDSAPMTATELRHFLGGENRTALAAHRLERPEPRAMK